MRGMFLFKPSEELILQFISSQRALQFSYSEVGASRQELPEGYTIDHNRIRLGTGAQSYDRALKALKRWRHFDLGWLSIVPAQAPVEIGSTVAVMAQHLGFWSLNACRIVYLIDEEGPEKDSSAADYVKKSGFAYGTLLHHVESGEERFTVEWQASDDSVWYDILAFSRPNRLFVRIGYPLARLMQKRFARESLAAMVRAIHE